MAALETSYLFDGELQHIFQAICQFDRYPRYLPGVTGIQVLPAKDPKATCQVRYELNIVKTFYYTLEMYQEEPHKIWWHLVDSNLMKKNDGSWTFAAAEQGKTSAVYKVDVAFRGLVPSMITDQIAKANLPLMFSGFQKLANDYKVAP